MSDFEDGGFGIVMGMFSEVLLQDGIDSYGDPGGFDNERTDGLIGPGRDPMYELFLPRSMNPGYNADEGGKFLKGMKASEVSNFGQDVGGGEGPDAGDGSEQGVILVVVSAAPGFDAPGEVFDLAVNEVILKQHALKGQLNGGIVPLQVIEPLEESQAPGGFVKLKGNGQVVIEQETFDAGFDFSKIPDQGGSLPGEATEAFSGNLWDVDFVHISGPELFGNDCGIDLIGFDKDIGSGQICRINDKGIPAKVNELSGGGKATRAGFISDAYNVIGVVALDIIFELEGIGGHSLATANG